MQLPVVGQVVVWEDASDHQQPPTRPQIGTTQTGPPPEGIASMLSILSCNLESPTTPGCATAVVGRNDTRLAKKKGGAVIPKGKHTIAVLIHSIDSNRDHCGRFDASVGRRKRHVITHPTHKDMQTVQTPPTSQGM
jgi:hypothetical protein